MARVNLNTHDLISLIDCLNDSILRSSSTIKINQLESLKSRLAKALEGHEQEPQQEQDLIKPIKRSKKSSPQM
jgi:ElaB/YqjD/DUF883 family membrane-anchored ribosome-binding protein